MVVDESELELEELEDEELEDELLGAGKVNVTVLPSELKETLDTCTGVVVVPSVSLTINSSADGAVVNA